MLDIALYRDDLSDLAIIPIVRPTELSFDITGRTIALVDGATSQPPARNGSTCTS